MTSLKRVSGLLLVLALVLGLQAVAYAQTGAASITGLVTDQSGAATPGVTVTATNQATNVDYTAVTNATGNYDIRRCPSAGMSSRRRCPGSRRRPPGRSRSRRSRSPAST